MELVNALTNNRTLNRHGLTIAWGVSLFLLLLVVLGIAYSQYSSYKQRTVDLSPQTLPPIASNRKPQYRASDITAANLFGDPRPKEVVAKNIKTTSLNLKLIGVLWASDQNMARVIIESGGKKANLYSVGDSIQGASASVKEIRSNEILISRNGATEKLPLIKKKGGNDIISYETVSFADAQSFNNGQGNIGRSSNRKPISPNGQNRKIRKPNFSGLDRALQKMGEI